MKFNKLKINCSNPASPKIIIDGKEIKSVTDVKIHIPVDDVVKVTVEFVPDLIETIGAFETDGELIAIEKSAPFCSRCREEYNTSGKSFKDGNSDQ